MNEETQIRLAAWFDGELSPEAAQEVEALLEHDAEARAYVESLITTRSALQSAHAGAVEAAPDWARVEERLDEAVPEADRRRTLPFWRLIASVAAVMLLGMALWIPFRQASISSSTSSAPGDNLLDTVEMVETDLVGATPIVYLDQPSGWTVVWVLEAEDAEEI